MPTGQQLRSATSEAQHAAPPQMHHACPVHVCPLDAAVLDRGGSSDADSPPPRMRTKQQQHQGTPTCCCARAATRSRSPRSRSSVCSSRPCAVASLSRSPSADSFCPLTSCSCCSVTDRYWASCGLAPLLWAAAAARDSAVCRSRRDASSWPCERALAACQERVEFRVVA